MNKELVLSSILCMLLLIMLTSCSNIPKEVNINPIYKTLVLISYHNYSAKCNNWAVMRDSSKEVYLISKQRSSEMNLIIHKKRKLVIGDSLQVELLRYERKTKYFYIVNRYPGEVYLDDFLIMNGFTIADNIYYCPDLIFTNKEIYLIEH